MGGFRQWRADNQQNIQSIDRNDLKGNPPVIFQEKLFGSQASSILPHFELNGIHMYNIKRQQIYLLAATAKEVVPVIIIELLSRIYQLLKDCLGSWEEAVIRSNIAVINEVLDECIDCGYVQLSSTEKIRRYILSEPQEVNSQLKVPGLFGLEQGKVESDAANRSVISKTSEQDGRQTELFVDVIERLSALIASNGEMLRSEIEGEIRMKAFVSKAAKIKVQLNEDLTVGLNPEQRGYGHVTHLDDCSFHACVDKSDFNDSRCLSITPPEGEFTALSYSLRGNLPLNLPLRVQSYVKASESGKDIEVNLKLRCEVPSSCHIANLTAHLPVPRATSNVTQQLTGYGQSASFVTSEQKILWRVDHLSSKADVTAHFKIMGAINESSSHLYKSGGRKPQVGPLAIEFEVSGFVCSNLKIKQLDVTGQQQESDLRKWLRFLTTSDSYVVKLT